MRRIRFHSGLKAQLKYFSEVMLLEEYVLYDACGFRECID